MNAFHTRGEQKFAVTSYRDLRIGIGILGIALPWVLLLGVLATSGSAPGSISSYYYTDVRNVFVGTMWAIGFFLLFYRYGLADTVLTGLAGGLAILVSLFPTSPVHPTAHQRLIGDFHLGFAATFLLMLAVICAFRFTKTDATRAPTARKKVRNKIYYGCGGLIAAGVVAAALFEILTSDAFRNSSHAIFWCESVAVVSFGVAWLVKGETLFKDRPERSLVTEAADDTARNDGVAPLVTEVPGEAPA
jgi:hypothetical protein